MRVYVPLAAILAANLLAGCASSKSSETDLLRGEVNSLTRAVNDLQMRVAAIKSDVCLDSTPSGDVVVPCPDASRRYPVRRY